MKIFEASLLCLSIGCFTKAVLVLLDYANEKEKDKDEN
jgi:hypothetical protein